MLYKLSRKLILPIVPYAIVAGIIISIVSSIYDKAQDDKRKTYKYCYYELNDSIYNAYSISRLNEFTSLQQFYLKMYHAKEIGIGREVMNISQIYMGERVSILDTINDSIIKIQHRSIFYYNDSSSKLNNRLIKAYVPAHVLHDSILNKR